MLNFGASQSALGGLERSRVTGRWTNGPEQKVERPEKGAGEETVSGGVELGGGGKRMERVLLSSRHLRFADKEKITFALK